MKIRVLVEQPARRDDPERHYLGSGAEVDISNDWAKELLNRGDAEPIAATRAAKSEKRAATKKDAE